MSVNGCERSKLGDLRDEDASALRFDLSKIHSTAADDPELRWFKGFPRRRDASEGQGRGVVGKIPNSIDAKWCIFGPVGKIP